MIDLAEYYDAALPVDLLSLVTLTTGSHDSRAKGVCAMELVAWLAGEANTDRPQCACPAITAYVVRLNDCGPQWVRDAIRDRAPKIVGTRAPVETQKKRMRIFAEAAIKSAEGVLPLFEKRRPGDGRPRKAIEAAKACLANPTKAYAAAAADAADAADAAYAAYAAAAAYAAYAADAAYAASAAYAAAAAYAAYAAYAAAANWQDHIGALDAAIAVKDAA